MESALKTLKGLKDELESSHYRYSFSQKLELLAEFIDKNLDDVIDEITEGIERLEEAENELSDAKEEIERLERESE